MGVTRISYVLSKFEKNISRFSQVFVILLSITHPETSIPVAEKKMLNFITILATKLHITSQCHLT